MWVISQNQVWMIKINNHSMKNLGQISSANSNKSKHKNIYTSSFHMQISLENVPGVLICLYIIDSLYFWYISLLNIIVFQTKKKALKSTISSKAMLVNSHH